MNKVKVLNISKVRENLNKIILENADAGVKMLFTQQFRRDIKRCSL